MEFFACLCYVPLNDLYNILLLYFYRPKLLSGLISLFELPEDSSVPEDEHFVEIEDTPGNCTL